MAAPASQNTRSETADQNRSYSWFILVKLDWKRQRLGNNLHLLPIVDLMNQCHLLQEAGFRTQGICLAVYSTFVASFPLVAAFICTVADECNDQGNLVSQLTDSEDSEGEYKDFPSGRCGRLSSVRKS